MRVVTMKELDALLEAVRLVRESCAKLSGMCEAVTAVSWGMLTDNPLGALAVGAKGRDAIFEENERMYQQFEIAAFNFLGESRKFGETSEDYFHRICGMSEAELLTTPARNGLCLKL